MPHGRVPKELYYNVLARLSYELKLFMCNRHNLLTPESDLNYHTINHAGV